MNEIVAVAGLLIGLLGVMYAILSHHLNRRTVQAQRIFAPASPEFLIENQAGLRHLGIGLPFEGKRRGFELPLRLAVHNGGKKSAEDLEIAIRINSLLALGGRAELELSPSASGVGLQVNTYHSGEFVTYLFNLKAIHPGRTIRWTMPITLAGPSEFPGSAEATTKDGKTVSIDFKARMSYELMWSLFGRDLDPVSGRVLISVADGGIEAVTDLLLKGRSAQIQKRMELPRWIRLLFFLFRLKERRTALAVVAQGLPVDRKEEDLLVSVPESALHGYTVERITAWRPVLRKKS